MSTVQNIIDAAFRKTGVTPSATDRTNALENLNNLVSSLGVEFLNYYYVRETLALSTGDAEYTMGSGGDLDTVRPLKIIDAFIRDANGYDFPLDIQSEKEYNDISSKTAEGRPTILFFVPEYPLAKMLLDYEPAESYTLHILSYKNFTEFSAISDTYSLPLEFKDLLVYNLAISLAEDFGVNLSESTIRTARDLKANMLIMNAAIRPVPEAKFDYDTNYHFNIITGE